MKRKKKKQCVPCFVFSPETIAITQKAVQRFEQPSQQAAGNPALLAFAAATIKRVEEKLATLSTSGGGTYQITFDYNEKVVIGMALQSYMLELLATPADALQARKLSQCQQIVHFMFDHLEPRKDRPRGK